MSSYGPRDQVDSNPRNWLQRFLYRIGLQKEYQQGAETYLRWLAACERRRLVVVARYAKNPESRQTWFGLLNKGSPNEMHHQQWEEHQAKKKAAAKVAKAEAETAQKQ